MDARDLFSASHFQVVQQQQQQQHQQQQAQHPDPAMQAAQLELATGATPVPNTNALAIRRPFDPTAHDLDANFRLTRFADLKG
jgi:hypothetical protein